MILSAISLGIIFYLVDFARLIAAIRNANFRYLLAGIGMTILWLLVRTVVWRSLLQNHPRFGDVFISLNEGYLMNNLLPFRLGEIGRAFLLGRKANLDFWQVIPTVIVERSLDLALGAGLFLSTVPFVVGAEWARQAAMGTGLLVIAGLLTLFLIARFRRRIERLIFAQSEKNVLVRKIVGQRAGVFLEGLSILAKPLLFLRSLGLITLNWGIGVGQFYCFVRAFFPEGNVLWAAFSLGALALGMSAPSTPGNLGVYELALVSALSLLSGDISKPTALAITAHAIQYLTTGIPGIYGLFRDGETLPSLYRKARSIQ